MRSKLSVIVVLVCILLLAFFYLRPYSNIEINAATAYYQSYSQLQRNIEKYVDMLGNYNNTEEKIYLERALIKLESITENLAIFKLINQIDFRDTIINEKVIKPDIFTIVILNDMETYYYDSFDILNYYIEDKDIKLDKSKFKDFVNYNELIFSGLTHEEVGYDSEKKEFKVVLDELNLAYKNQLSTNSVDFHKGWIEVFLKEYYDPLYKYSLEKIEDKIIFRGSSKEVTDFFKTLK